MATLNCLPDELLVKILSSVTTKQAASTSLLSKRWRTLYTIRDNLDFDDSVFFSNNNINDIQRSFGDFVDKTLALQQGFVNGTSSFSLKCGDDQHNTVRVDRWICKAMELGVSELHLSITTRFHHAWLRLYPSKLFKSTTLVKLSLGTRRAIDGFPSDTSLPSLKTLFLDRIRFDSEEFSNVFLPACPLLEELTVHHDSFPGMRYVISSKTVKRLSLSYISASCTDYQTLFTLDMPSVVEFYCSDYAVRKYLNCNLDSLEKATLDLHLSVNKRLLEQLYPDVTHLINAIRNIKTLHLTSSAVEVISVCCRGELPVFENLVDLKFSSKTEQGWKVFLPLLIEHSPNLETLLLSGLEGGLAEFIGIPINNRVRITEEVRTNCHG